MGMIDEYEIKATHMDDHLKMTLNEYIKAAIGFYIEGRDKESFKAFSAILRMISPYEFSMKTRLLEMTDIIIEHINQLEHEKKPFTRYELIEIFDKKRQVKELIQLYMSEVPKACAELGLWFKVVQHYNNDDLTFAKESFNSEYTLVENKRKALLKLSTEQLIALMKPIHINDIYAKMRFDDAV